MNLLKNIFISILLTLTFLDLNAADKPPKDPSKLARHQIGVVTPDGGIFFNGDGVSFATNPDDVYKSADLLDKYVIIMPGTPSSNYNYILVDEATGNLLEVAITSDPIKRHLTPPPAGQIRFYSWKFICGKIEYISENEAYISLNNYTNWCSSSEDIDTVKEWNTGDHIVIGLNNDDSSDIYPAILININKQNHIRVR